MIKSTVDILEHRQKTGKSQPQLAKNKLKEYQTNDDG
jgi:hypothetical protein